MFNKKEKQFILQILFDRLEYEIENGEMQTEKIEELDNIINKLKNQI
jgi:hypothetical protein